MVRVLYEPSFLQTMVHAVERQGEDIVFTLFKVPLTCPSRYISANTGSHGEGASSRRLGCPVQAHFSGSLLAGAPLRRWQRPVTTSLCWRCWGINCALTAGSVPGSLELWLLLRLRHTQWLSLRCWLYTGSARGRC